jgi:hypothetical protein
MVVRPMLGDLACRSGAPARCKLDLNATRREPVGGLFIERIGRPLLGESQGGSKGKKSIPRAYQHMAGGRTYEMGGPPRPGPNIQLVSLSRMILETSSSRDDRLLLPNCHPAPRSTRRLCSGLQAAGVSVREF